MDGRIKKGIEATRQQGTIAAERVSKQDRLCGRRRFSSGVVIEYRRATCFQYKAPIYDKTSPVVDTNQQRSGS
jgi:hypothetical protein